MDERAPLIEVSIATAISIINTREPHGLFYLKEGDRFVGIDNTTGDAWTEDFASEEECLNWLTGEEVRDG